MACYAKKPTTVFHQSLCVPVLGQNTLDIRLCMAGMSTAVFPFCQGCSRHLCSTPAGAPGNAEAEEASADSDSAESMEEPETGEESSEADSQTSNRRRPAGLQAVCRLQEVGLHRMRKADLQQQHMHSVGTAQYVGAATQTPSACACTGGWPATRLCIFWRWACLRWVGGS